MAAHLHTKADLRPFSPGIPEGTRKVAASTPNASFIWNDFNDRRRSNFGMIGALWLRILADYPFEVWVQKTWNG
jgi:hypothetical protein